MIREYSQIIDLSDFDFMNWMSTDNCLEKLGEVLDDYEHYDIIPSGVNTRRIPLETEKALINQKHLQTLKKTHPYLSNDLDL